MKKRRTDEELKEILLTVDGKGKAEKAKALEELLTREYQQGFDECDSGRFFDELMNIGAHE